MNRHGAALLEVLIALVILSTAGVSTLRYVAAVVNDRVRIEAREDELMEAEQTLIAMSLVSRRELEQRLGSREVGSHTVHVSRPEPTLFRLSVAAAQRPTVELLVTVVHRPAEEDGNGP